MLRFSDSGAMLHAAMEEMLRNWDRTASVWRDEARRDFEEHYLEELRPGVTAACNSMKNIHALLRKVRSECS